MRLIDADALMECYNLKDATKYGNRDAEQQAHSYSTLMMYEIADMIEDAPTVEAVPKSYSDQIRWERDIAIEQLNEIGCQFGQKMDDVKKKLEAEPVVHGEWIGKGFAYKCSVCGNREPESTKEYADKYWNYCPNCGAKMDGGVSDD